MSLTLSSQQREALKNKGREFYTRKLYRDALEQFDKAAQGSPTISILDYRAATHEKLANLDAALQDAMSMIKLQKDLDKGYLRCGDVLQKMGKDDKALAVYDKGLQRCQGASTSLDALEKARDMLQTTLNQKYGVDFIDKLPTELLEMVFSWLPFHAMCKCLLVSRGWNQRLKATERLWQAIDFSAARKKIPAKTVIMYVIRSQNKVRSLVLRKVTIQGSGWLPRLLRSCDHLSELTITTGGEIPNTLIRMVKNARNLRKVVTGPAVVLMPHTHMELLKARPTLVHLDCQHILLPNQGSPEDGTDYANLQHLGLGFNDGTGDSPVSWESGARGVLPLASNLHTLRITVGRSPEPSNLGFVTRINSATRSFEKLQTLVLHGVEVSLMCGALRVLRLYRKHTHFAMEDVFRETDNLTEVHLDCHHRGEENRTARDIERRLLRSATGPPYDVFHIGVPRIIDEDLQFTAMLNIIFHPRLKSVRDLALFDGQDMVTDNEAKMIADTMDKLERVSLRGSYITGVGVKSLVSGLPKLGYLDVTDCFKISGDALDWARAQGVQVNTSFQACPL